MFSSAVTAKGQVTIPNKMRRALNLHAGDKVAFVLENDHIILFRKQNNVEAAFGLHKAKKSVSLADMEEAIQKRGKT